MSKKELFTIIGMVALTPLVIAIGVSLPIFSYVDNSSPWIGFWGSYVGSIFGGVITLIVLQKTLNNNKEILDKTIQIEREKEERNRKLMFLDDICEKIQGLSFDMLTCMHEKDAEKMAMLYISAEILSVKLKSRQDEYINCDKLIKQLKLLSEKYYDFHNVMFVEKKNSEEEKFLREIGPMIGIVNKQAVIFYEENIKKI